MINGLSMFSGTKVRIISTLVERWASWMAAAQLPSTWQEILRWRKILKQAFWGENPVSETSKVFGGEEWFVWYEFLCVIF